MSFLFDEVPDYDGLAVYKDLFHQFDELPEYEGLAVSWRPAS